MPEEFDAYVTPVEGGFEAAAGGRVIGVFEVRAQALGAARIAAPAGPLWWVGEDGEAVRVA